MEDTSITDDASATSAAQVKVRTSLPVPVFIDSQDVTLSPEAAVTVPKLVPGWCLDVTSNTTCRTITQRLKIVGVKVTEDGGTSDEPGAERVQVQLAAGDRRWPDMGLRGGPTRRLPGNALGGMLRDLDRRSRTPSPGRGRRREQEAQEDMRQEPMTAAAAVPVAAVAVTGEDGRARWKFPAPLTATPVLTALPVDPAPDDDERTVTVAVEEVTPWYAVVRVWRTRPRRGQGVASPVGEGVRVHLVAVDATG